MERAARDSSLPWGHLLHTHMCIVHCLLPLAHTLVCECVSVCSSLSRGPFALALVYCASCTCLFACLQHCVVCARVCNVHGAPLSPGGLLHSPLVTLLTLARWQHFALCAFSPGKRLLLHAHFAFCILLFCICTVFVFIFRHKCTAVPWGAPLVTRRIFAAESPHFTSHFPSLSASPFYDKSQINQALESLF